MAVAIDQNAYRWRLDDGSETTANWAAAINTPLAGTLDTNYRLRILTSIASGTGPTSWTPQLQYNRNGAGWNNVNAASSVARSSASPNVADGAATTGQIGSAGSFAAGRFDEVDGLANASVSLDDAGNTETEAEHCFQVRSADVAAGDVIEFRLIKSPATAYDSYTRFGVFTVAGGAAQTKQFYMLLDS